MLAQAEACGYHKLLFDSNQAEPRKTRLILGKDGMVPDFVVQEETGNPAKQKIIIRLIHQQSGAVDGLKDLQPQGAPQLLRPPNFGLFNNRLDVFKNFIGVLEGADMDEEDFPAPIQHYDQRISGEF